MSEKIVQNTLPDPEVRFFLCRFLLLCQAVNWFAGLAFYPNAEAIRGTQLVP